MWDYAHLFVYLTTEPNEARAGLKADAGQSPNFLKPITRTTNAHIGQKKTYQSALCKVCFVMYSNFFPVKVQTTKV